MKNATHLLIFVLLLCGCTPNPADQKSDISENENPLPVYDSVLAARLGSDDYGMKKYMMAFLKAGPNRDHDSATVAKIQREHLDNILRLANEGKLIMAGPFLDGSELRGIFIFDVATLEEAQALVETDPAVKAGRLSMELHPWYGSAALMQVNELHERIQKKKI